MNEEKEKYISSTLFEMNFKDFYSAIKKMKLGGCKFRKQCEHYREDSFTCNSFFTSDLEYCGKYRKLSMATNPTNK